MRKYLPLCLLFLAFPAFAAIDISVNGLLEVLVYLVVWGLILAVLWWAVGKLGLPAPFAQGAQVVLVILTVIILLSILMGFMGHPMFSLH